MIKNVFIRFKHFDSKKYNHQRRNPSSFVYISDNNLFMMFGKQLFAVRSSFILEMNMNASLIVEMFKRQTNRLIPVFKNGTMMKKEERKITGLKI